MLPNCLRKPDDGLAVPKVPSDEWIPEGIDGLKPIVSCWSGIDHF